MSAVRGVRFGGHDEHRGHRDQTDRHTSYPQAPAYTPNPVDTIPDLVERQVPAIMPVLDVRVAPTHTYGATEKRVVPALFPLTTSFMVYFPPGNRGK